LLVAEIKFRHSGGFGRLLVRLFVVSSDLRRATDAFAVASTLQSALDDWDRISPKLADLAEALEEGTAPHISFDPAQCAGDTSIGPRELGRAGERAAKRRCMVRIPRSVLLLHSDISTFKRK